MKKLGLAVIPLAIRDMKRLQVLDISDNILLCTPEHPVEFSTAETALSPNAECVRFVYASQLASGSMPA